MHSAILLDLTICLVLGYEILRFAQNDRAENFFVLYRDNIITLEFLSFNEEFCAKICLAYI